MCSLDNVAKETLLLQSLLCRKVKHLTEVTASVLMMQQCERLLKQSQSVIFSYLSLNGRLFRKSKKIDVKVRCLLSKVPSRRKRGAIPRLSVCNASRLNLIFQPVLGLDGMFQLLRRVLEDATTAGPHPGHGARPRCSVFAPEKISCIREDFQS